MRFLDKVAMITGGSGEIGREIALNFAREGALVAVGDLSFMAAESVTDKIKEMKRKALPFKADVTNPQEMEAVVGEVVSSFGKIDILVHCAGIRRDSPFHAMTDTAWDEVMNVQLKGCFTTARLAQKYMVRDKYGKIIIIASPVPSDMEISLGMVGQANYDAANAGLMGLTTSLAIELGPYNINVNCVAPEFIETKMTIETVRRQGMYMDDFKKAVLAHIPLRRLGTVADVSNTVLFLACEESDYITGQVIKVKGGP